MSRTPLTILSTSLAIVQRYMPVLFNFVVILKAHHFCNIDQVQGHKTTIRIRLHCLGYCLCNHYALSDYLFISTTHFFETYKAERSIFRALHHFQLSRVSNRIFRKYLHRTCSFCSPVQLRANGTAGPVDWVRFPVGSHRRLEKRYSRPAHCWPLVTLQREYKNEYNKQVNLQNV